MYIYSSNNLSYENSFAAVRAMMIQFSARRVTTLSAMKLFRHVPGRESTRPLLVTALELFPAGRPGFIPDHAVRAGEARIASSWADQGGCIKDDR
ncbi:hypothetical protein [Labrys miyagiensis]|uniref:hypothetical protein n=1 Tax=Labrys miyagiensis TaxID=346912 RepID=UPI0024E1312D|nr:hypothetical protein [Labrys miyagiensis]